MVKISDAELEVMKVVWKRGKTTSMEIIEDLKDSRWNYNTIRTLIKRLLVKGAIEIVKKEGKTYTYSATITERDYKGEVTRNLLQKLYHGSLDDLVIQYCREEALTIEQIKEMNQKIDEMIIEKEKND